jgi:hypothetical protein
MAFGVLSNLQSGSIPKLPQPDRSGKARTRPHRNHVELRSRDVLPPRQCVADDHSGKPSARPPREINAMTAALAAMFRRQTWLPTPTPTTKEKTND